LVAHGDDRYLKLDGEGRRRIGDLQTDHWTAKDGTTLSRKKRLAS
jgi:hypothetical protein